MTVRDDLRNLALDKFDFGLGPDRTPWAVGQGLKLDLTLKTDRQALFDNLVTYYAATYNRTVDDRHVTKVVNLLIAEAKMGGTPLPSVTSADVHEKHPRSLRTSAT